eukprot:1479529-Amphidinium_carterae.1
MEALAELGFPVREAEVEQPCCIGIENKEPECWCMERDCLCCGKCFVGLPDQGGGNIVEYSVKQSTSDESRTDN